MVGRQGYTWLAANTREIRKKLEVKYKFRQKEIRWWVGGGRVWVKASWYYQEFRNMEGRKEGKGRREGRRPCRQIAHFLLEAQAEVN